MKLATSGARLESCSFVYVLTYVCDMGSNDILAKPFRNVHGAFAISGRFGMFNPGTVLKSESGPCGPIIL